MVILKNQFEKDVFRSVMIIVGIVAACRFTSGFFAVGMAAMACYWAISQKGAKALICYILFPFLIIMNPMLLPKGGVFSLAMRAGTAAMAMSFMIAAASRKGQHSLPMGCMFFYMVAATVSSVGGYCPIISYFKELNFVFFIVGVWLGTCNIYRDPREMYKLRCFLLAICALLVWGTYLTMLSPGLSHPQTVSQLMQWGRLSRAEAMAAAAYTSEVSFLAGVANHSNALAPNLACAVGFLLCDMLFVERRPTRFHVATLIGTLPLLFMTHSRGALVSFVAAVAIVFMFSTTKIPTPLKVKNKARKIMFAFIWLAIIGAIYLEATDRRFTKWVRKTENVEADQRDLSEALTQSRMGLVSENMRDFYRNPMFGMGFQTCEDHQLLYQAGAISIFSAPIEKGVLPTMILGETGVAGALTFILWLTVFVGVCMRKKYICTVSLLGVLLCTNMGEASFFSPGGVGGMLWIMSVVGGFITDMQILTRRQYERMGYRRPNIVSGF